MKWDFRDSTTPSGKKKALETASSPEHNKQSANSSPVTTLLLIFPNVPRLPNNANHDRRELQNAIP